MTCLLIVSSLPVYAAGTFSLPNGAVVYNTGIDLSAGIDQRYQMTVNPYNGSTAAYLSSASYLSANNADSAWLSPAGDNIHTPESVYHIATEVDMSGIDLATISLHGYWVSDNKGLDILVNGSSTGQTNNGGHLSQPDASEDNRFVISQSDGLIDGANTITFVWGNGPAGGAGSQFPNPTHVRVEFTGYSISLPGDLNEDGFVGLDDLDIVLQNWNQTVPPADTRADPSGDGFVGLDDLDTVLNNWNAGTPPVDHANIPEPAVATIMVLGWLALVPRKHP